MAGTAVAVEAEGSLEDVLSRSKIEFPTPIGDKQFLELLEHISKELRCEIGYRQKTNGQIGEAREEINGAYKLIHRRETNRFDGSILRWGERRQAFSGFDCKIDFSGEQPTFSGINFELIGYNKKEVIELWDDTRAAVARYFAQRKD